MIYYLRLWEPSEHMQVTDFRKCMEFWHGYSVMVFLFTSFVLNSVYKIKKKNMRQMWK